MLTISNLTYRIAGRDILTNASVSVAAGHHAGLIGRNGAGKSTLLKIISRDLQADSLVCSGYERDELVVHVSGT